ncbi:MAG: adenine phosphoribosyltransferase [Micrococcales bacterium]|nr:adenine phosphoribosyltransferase [Micrococcales bacterium]
MNSTLVGQLVAAGVRDVADFPRTGVVFKDITPLLADGSALGQVTDYMGDLIKDAGATLVVGIEARGFVLAVPAALRAGLGFVPLRKPGKLPGAKISQTFALEYGQATLEMHQDAVAPGSRVVIVDDVLATGGTAEAACQLVERAGGQVIGLQFLIELQALGGRAALGDRPITSLLVT